MTTTATENSLRDLIRAAIEAGLVDPSDIAAKVLAQLGDADLRDALDETLRHYVVAVISNVRKDHRENSESHSSRAGLVRDWYQSWLRQPMHAGDKWLSLGDCTAADLRAAVAERRDHAERTFAIANQLDALADALADHKVTYVNQLPKDIAARLTGRAS